MADRRTKTYRYGITFDAPLRYVFGWCTDYQPDDAAREGETYQRKVLERTKRRVVYEDLEESPQGWFWARHIVTLTPPTHWHSSSIGSHREYELDYTLRTLSNGRTELKFVGRRRPTGVASRNPTTAEFDRSMDASWQQFRTQLEAEYRGSTKSGRPARARKRRAP